MSKYALDHWVWRFLEKIVVLHILLCHGSPGTPFVAMAGSCKQKACFHAGVSPGWE